MEIDFTGITKEPEFKEEVPRVFEERGFLTGCLVGGVGSKWQGLAGVMVTFTLLFGYIYVGWRGMYV